MEATESMRKILVVDDDADLVKMVSEALQAKARVISAGNGRDGLQRCRAELPDLVLLDLRMPDGDGVTACRGMRSAPETREIPIIVLTGAASPEDRVEAFQAGADDLLPKPFSIPELHARVDSKLRRLAERERKKAVLTCGDVQLDADRLEVRAAGQRVGLTVLEFNLLRYFIENQECVLNRDRILRAVWQDTVVSARTVDTHVVSLRRKLAASHCALETIYGAGYALHPTRPERFGPEAVQ